jgi:hypothetical protein
VIDSAPVSAAGAKEVAMPRLFAVAVVAALALVAAPAGADAPRSLGEVAAKEKEKKKGKVYTEDDLRNPKRGGSYSQPAAEGGSTAATTTPAAGEKKPEAGASPAAAKPKTDDELRAEAETAWREKMTQAQADVATWTGEVTRLQTSLNDTKTVYGPGRAAVAESFENAKRQLAAANTAVENLQEEGRRNRYR